MRRSSHPWKELWQRLGNGTVGIGGIEAHWSVAIRAGHTWLKLIGLVGETVDRRPTLARPKLGADEHALGCHGILP
ncbi:MAG: hypothetical protein ACK4NE_02540 [Albidovulum sp.]